MHEKFADWYRPATFGNDRQTFELRWNGVAATIGNLNFPLALELIRLAFGRSSTPTKYTDVFRQYFKTSDAAFLTSGNDEEVQTLAGCVLALLCLDESYDFPEVPMAILTASACKTRSPKVEIDLVGMATERVQMDGAKARQRPLISTQKVLSDRKGIETAIAPFSSTQDFPNAIESLKNLGSVLDNLVISVQKNSNIIIAALQKFVTLQDEELQILWWMVGGWSEMWKSAFIDLDPKARPILLSKEAAVMTEVFSELPSLRAVFYRVGIEEEPTITIPDAVNACGPEFLKAFLPEHAQCPTIFPLHSAMSRAHETGADKSWISAWSKVAGLAQKTQVMPLELSLQVHREIKLIEKFGANDE